MPSPGVSGSSISPALTLATAPQKASRKTFSLASTSSQPPLLAASQSLYALYVNTQGALGG